MPVPATILGFWEGSSCRDGTVPWTGLVGREDGACTDGSPMLLLGACLSPLSSHVWPCPLAVSLLVSAWSWRRLGWALFRRKSFGGSGLLARSRSHTSPKCQGQTRREAQLSPLWMESTNRGFGLSLPKEGRGPRMAACTWKNSELMHSEYASCQTECHISSVRGCGTRILFVCRRSSGQGSLSFLGRRLDCFSPVASWTSFLASQARRTQGI